MTLTNAYLDEKLYKEAYHDAQFYQSIHRKKMPISNESGLINRYAQTESRQGNIIMRRNMRTKPKNPTKHVRTIVQRALNAAWRDNKKRYGK